MQIRVDSRAKKRTGGSRFHSQLAAYKTEIKTEPVKNKVFNMELDEDYRSKRRRLQLLKAATKKPAQIAENIRKTINQEEL